MAVIYAEDWTPGSSLFQTVYYYQKSVNGADPLYPFMDTSEGCCVNGDGRLDKNPAFVGPFQDYSTAGIWIKDAGLLTGFGDPGYWDGQQGCVECLYYPTVDSLADLLDAPLITVSLDGSGQVSISANLIDQSLVTVARVDAPGAVVEATLTGAPMPVAGEPYKVRLGWQCGTYDFDAGTVAPDGFLKAWINDELVYEGTDLAIHLNWNTVPANRIHDVSFGFAGLLGPLDYFTINDSACAALAPLPFKSGGTEYPLAWMEITRKELP